MKLEPEPHPIMSQYVSAAEAVQSDLAETFYLEGLDAQHEDLVVPTTGDSPLHKHSNSPLAASYKRVDFDL